MSASWIKFRKVLIKDGRVRKMSALMSAFSRTNVREILGCLVILWSLADDFADENGVLFGWSKEDVNSEIGVPNFCENLPAEWIDLSGEWVKLPEYLRHNGSTAKKRATDSVRKMSARMSEKSRKNVRKKTDKCPSSSSLLLSDLDPKISDLGRGAGETNQHVDKSAAGQVPIPGVVDAAIPKPRAKARRVEFTIDEVKFPPGMDTPVVREALALWLEHKKTKGKSYASARQVEILLETWAEHGPEVFMREVRRAYSNGWDGIHLDTKQSSKGLSAQKLPEGFSEVSPGCVRAPDGELYSMTFLRNTGVIK